MPNYKKSKQGIELSKLDDENLYKAGEGDEIRSPSLFLMNEQVPALDSFNIKKDAHQVQIEGEMIRKATETKLKKYWYCLLGKELYVYKT